MKRHATYPGAPTNTRALTLCGREVRVIIGVVLPSVDNAMPDCGSCLRVIDSRTRAA